MSKKAVKTVVNESRKRFNVALDLEVRQRGDVIAEVERRSFSNLLEVLIDREYDRLFPAGAKSNGKQKALVRTA